MARYTKLAISLPLQCARKRGHRIVTSDPVDIARLDPSLPIILV
jgi:hypothetical protein